MPVRPIKSSNEFRAIASIVHGEMNVVMAVHFWATSSDPSKTLSLVFEGLSNENRNMRFCNIDVDELQDLAQELAISTMPTFMIFKDGKKVDELVDADEGKLKALTESYK